MNTIFKTTFLLLASLAFVSCEREIDNATSTQTFDTRESEVRPYPIDTCLVSGEELGSMGEPVTFVHQGQEIKLCCDACQPKFEEDPAKYLAELSSKAE